MRSARAVPIVLAAVAALGACGGGDGGDGGQADDQPVDLVQRGAELVESSGCQSCHEAEIAPGWDGLYGSTVQLDDGTTVVADEEYLARAITDPDAETVAGYTIAMPQNDLDDDEVAAIVAYLRSLGGPSGGSTP